MHFPGRGEYTARLELGRNGTEAAGAFFLDLAQHGEHVGYALCHLAAASLPHHCGHGGRGRHQARVAQLHPARLGHGQGRARALADQPSLQLRHCRHLRDQELADRSGWHGGQVAEHHAGLAAALDHGEQEARVAGQAV